MPLMRTESHFNKSSAMTPSTVWKSSRLASPWNVTSGNWPFGVRKCTCPCKPSRLPRMNRLSLGSRYGSSVPRSSWSRSSWMSAVGGRNDAVVVTLMEPLVFQRRDSSAVRLVPGTLEMFLAESAMSVRSSLAGRELTRSSRCNAQLVKFTLLTVPLHWFVLLSSMATALVTERSRNKIPPGAFVAGSAGWESSTTLMAFIRGAAQKKFRANGRHGIHRGLAAFQVSARAGDVEERQFDDVVAVTRLAEFEIAQGERRVMHGGDAVGGAQFKTVFRVQGDGAVADFEAHQVLIQRRVFVQREIEQFQLALRTQRVEVKKAAPRNLFARVGGAGEGVGIFVVRVGAEIFERDVERAERALERLARREIRERRRRAADVQPVNVQDERLGRRFGRGAGALVENLVMRSEKLNV